MKNLLLIITIMFSLNSYSQLTSIISDEFNDEIFSTYDEFGTLTVKCNQRSISLILDLDGSSKNEHSPIISIYQLLSDLELMWSDHNQSYNIMFTLSISNNYPTAGIIDMSNKSILLFYKDNSSLLYIGEGVKIII